LDVVYADLAFEGDVGFRDWVRREFSEASTVSISVVLLIRRTYQGAGLHKRLNKLRGFRSGSLTLRRHFRIELSTDFRCRWCG
jgi:hypothetical protein